VQSIFGNVTVNTNPSTIETRTTEFRSTATVTLNDDLNLAGDSTLESGATFSGGGSLINLTGSTLNLQDGADVDVLLDNQGTLVLGSNSLAQTTGLDFQQTATGVWEVELGGTALNEFDRMTLDGIAQLAGTLDLSLLVPYVPSLGETLNILSAGGGVSGTFDTVLQPAGMPAGLEFAVNYLAAGTIAQLEVVSSVMFTADFDMDGDVDGDDLTQWEGDFGMNGMSDADGDGDSDGGDFLEWQRQFGSGVPPSLASSQGVPEPGSLCMLLLGVAAMFGSTPRRRKR